MTGHFGPRVIGHQRAKEEAEVKVVGADHFGPRVIGDVLAKRRLEARQDDAAKDTRTSPAKKKAKKEAAKEEAPKAPVEAPVTTNLAELEEALESNAEFYESLYANEFIRPSGPRKSALRLFLKFEMAHGDREERKTEIEAALN